jgi:hypothetical protein
MVGVVGATRASHAAFSSPGSEEGEGRDADEVRSRSAGARVEHVAAGGAVVGAGGISPAVGAAHCSGNLHDEAGEKTGPLPDR